MASLRTVAQRFQTPFHVIDGGSGIVMGELSETDQTSQPSYIFVQPRHILRCLWPTNVRPGQVLRTNSGNTFIVGDNGPSEQPFGTLWKSFRLFEATGLYTWKRRTKITDAITKTDREGPLQDLGFLWAAIEPLDREQFDREIHRQFEQRRFITGGAVLSDDLLDNQAIMKVDKELGLSIGVLT